MTDKLENIVTAIEARDPGLGELPLPQEYLAATLHRDEEQMFAGRESRDKDPRESIHIEPVPVPELAPGEALIAVMASSMNYNTVWSSLFEPVRHSGIWIATPRPTTTPSGTRWTTT